MHNNLSKMILTGLGVVALSIPLTLSLSNAQSSTAQDAQQPGQFQRGGQGGPPPPGGGFAQPGGQPGFQPQPGMQRMPMMGGGGGTAMISDGAFLYILQGNRLMKVSKEDLRVVKTADINPPMPPGGPGFRPEGGATAPTGGGGGTKSK